MAMSLDRYIADPDDQVDEVFDWYEAGDVSVASGSANVIQQALGLGLVDEVCVSLVPVLSTSGIRSVADEHATGSRRGASDH